MDFFSSSRHHKTLRLPFRPQTRTFLARGNVCFLKKTSAGLPPREVSQTITGGKLLQPQRLQPQKVPAASRTFRQGDLIISKNTKVWQEVLSFKNFFRQTIDCRY
jgi:hypothetical protein